MLNAVTISLVCIITIAVIIFLIWQNKKDKKLINPDAQDSMEETITDHERREDKI